MFPTKYTKAYVSIGYDIVEVSFRYNKSEVSIEFDKARRGGTGCTAPRSASQPQLRCTPAQQKAAPGSGRDTRGGFSCSRSVCRTCYITIIPGREP
eukprot:5455499-Pyramimonas_sp.AAC.1